MITLKSRRQIEMMREASRLVVKAHSLVREMLEPGVTTESIDSAVERLFADHGATPLFKGAPGEIPYPAVTCISINEQVAHGIPGNRQLCAGDLVSVDTGCRLNGWCGDAAWTYPVGKVNRLKLRLLEAGQGTLQMAIREMGRRNTWSEVAQLIERNVKQAGFCILEQFVGHGIGCEMHEDPQVASYVSPQLRKNDFRLEPGMVLAIEPMISAGTKQLRLASDHWTIETCDRSPCVHFEHTVALTTDGPDVLTEGVGSMRPR